MTTIDLAGAPTVTRHYINGVNVGRQTLGKSDYDWTGVYTDLTAQNARTVEIYLQSFAPSLPHYSVLLQQVAAWAGRC